jgi:sugar phosphate permease
LGSRGPVHWAWVILGTCFVSLFVNYSIRLGYGIVLPEMIEALGFTRTAAGSIYNAYLVTYISLTPLAGYLTDRFGARGVITTCGLILGLGALLMGTVDSLLRACLFYALVGVGATGMWAPIITVVQRWFAAGRRGLALGILSPGYGLGFALTGVIFPWIVHRFSWRYTWYFMGAAALVMVVANGILLRDDPSDKGLLPWGAKRPADKPETSKDSPKPIPKTSLSFVIKNGSFWFLGLSYFSISYALYGITTFMVDYARVQLEMPLEKASLLATMHGSAQIIGVMIILPLSDAIGRKKTMVISNAAITASLFAILFLGASWASLFSIVGFMALFYGATFPIYGACVADLFPREWMGSAIGALTPFYGLGAILVHWVTGILRDTTGNYQYAFTMSAAMAATGLVLVAFVRSE